MENKLNKLKNEAVKMIRCALNSGELLVLENKLLGRKNGELTEIMKELKNLSPEEKKVIGQLANEVKNTIESELQNKAMDLNSVEQGELLTKEKLDITQPSLPPWVGGHFHPVTLIRHDLEDFFSSLGFSILDGPELESDYYNFSAVNIPADHPARDMQDTFYIKNHPDWVMRTHTSSVQVRALQKYGAPLKMISPGKCFRNEATDVRHEHTFFQLEGLVVGKDVNFGNMKWILEVTAKHLYGEETQVRFRPKFYPFVEPGVNGEVSCFLCQGRGCRLCKNSGWLEIFGAGMIHPNVLKEGDVDPKKNQGFAFGFGLTRLVMLKYGIEDIRLLSGGDLRFLKQF